MRDSPKAFLSYAAPVAEALRSCDRPTLKFDQMIAWFGPSFHTASLAFREIEVRKLARKLMRVRRISQRTGEEKKRRGQSPIITAVQPVIMDVIERRKWDPTMTMEALTREVNRAGKWQRLVSQDTVIRAIDGV